MRENGLSSQMYNRQTRKYDSSIGPQGKKAKNRLHRRFKTERPYQKMATDVSEYRYDNMSQDERVYLSPIKDLCSGEIVSYNIGDHPTTDFVMKPLIELIHKRPKLNYRMTVHSDQGIQYQTNAWRQTLKKNHIFSKHVTPGNLFRQCANGEFLSHDEGWNVLWTSLSNQAGIDYSHGGVDRIL